MTSGTISDSSNQSNEIETIASISKCPTQLLAAQGKASRNRVGTRKEWAPKMEFGQPIVLPIGDN